MPAYNTATHVVCNRCGKGRKPGVFEVCPHCGAPTGETIDRPTKPAVKKKQKPKKRN